MKNKWMVLIGFLTLFLPLLIIGLVYLIANINIFDNPEFWYGYMSYFGTIVLAVVALWQNENANMTNKRIMKQQLRQKIGYFNLVETIGERQKINKYKDICLEEKTTSEQNNLIEDQLIIDLKNVGEDIILSPRIVTAKINGCTAKLDTEITAIYINETIGFRLKNPRCKDENLKVDLSIGMHNTAGIYYTQTFNIELKRLPTDDPVTFMVRCFNTAIDFKEDIDNGCK